MKIKLYKLESCIKNLNTLTKRILPAKLSYAISRNTKLLIEEYQIMNEERQKILEKHCLRDENGKPVLKDNAYTYADDELKNAAIREQTELLETEIEVDIMMVPVSILEKCEEGRFDVLTVEEVSMLDFMIG